MQSSSMGSWLRTGFSTLLFAAAACGALAGCGEDDGSGAGDPDGADVGTDVGADVGADVGEDVGDDLPDSSSDAGEGADVAPDAQIEPDVGDDADVEPPRTPACGDGVLDDGEECDDGGANSDTEPDACRTDCTFARCGDGVLDDGEECDNGEANSDAEPNACRTDCTFARCGDGVLDDGEECDDGEANSDTEPDACRTDCTFARCGDGVLDDGEECDGDDFSGLSCPDLGWFSGGELHCTAECTVDTSTCVVGCPPDRFEPNGSLDEAAEVEPGYYPGLTACSGDIDFFQVEVCGLGQLAVLIEFNHSLGDLDMRLLDADGERLAISASANDYELIEHVNISAQPALHYIEVYGFVQAENTYDMTITVDCP